MLAAPEWESDNIKYLTIFLLLVSGRLSGAILAAALSVIGTLEGPPPSPAQHALMTL